MRRWLVTGGAALAAVVWARAGAEEPATITFFWHAGDRAEALLEISRQYTEDTGVSLTRDYWHLPEYPELLSVYERAVHDAVAGVQSPAESLARCAAEQDAILAGGPSAGESP